MNAETIEAARAALHQRILDANEARAALKAAKTDVARRLAQDILSSRTLSVEQAACFVAVMQTAERALAATSAFRELIGDMVLIDGIHRKARNLGALPAYLAPVTSNPEFQSLTDIAPEAMRTAKQQVDSLLKQLKAELV